MGSSPPFTILLIDDDASVRATIAIILSRCGFQVLEADGPQGARHCWAEHRDEIHLLITDVMLPQISGPDLVREFFQSSRKPPVIFATGVSSVAALDLTKDIEGAVVLQKPFRPRELTETIDRLRLRTP